MSKIQLFLSISVRYLPIYVVTLAVLIILLLFAKTYKSDTRAVCIGIIMIISFMIYDNGLILNGLQHGVFDPETTLAEINARLPNTPRESNLPDNLSNAMLIFFKFGCSDCEAVYQDLKLALQDQPNIYWVSSRSIQGQDLLSKYPIDETPSLVYIYPDGENFAIFELHMKNQAGEVVLNQDLLSRALELRHKKLTERT